MTLPAVTPLDVVDIVAVAFLVYLLLRLIRGTRGLYMLSGLLICIVALGVARTMQLKTLGWILGQLLASMVLVVVVIFQNDIRRFLTAVGRSPFFARGVISESDVVEELVRSAVSLANKKIGALIVVERGASVADHVEQGTVLDARLDRELLTSIFLTLTPLHDGAVVVQGSRLMMAGCLLPLSMSSDAAKIFGTRHRAALGLSEETDAVIVVISEERGVISLAVDGEIEENLDATLLRNRLLELLGARKRFWTFKSESA